MVKQMLQKMRDNDKRVTRAQTDIRSPLSSAHSE